MDIQLQAPVLSREGVDLGKIDRVIFDPQTGETKSVVVHKGLILARDVSIPTTCIRVAAPTRVELTLSKEEVDRLPDFVEADYTWPPESWTAPYGWPPGAVMWGTSYGIGYPYAAPNPQPVPDEVAELVRQEDRQNAVVGEGAEVLAKDGEKVGSVQNVLVDTTTRRPARVVLRRGFLFTEDVELPGEWVASFDDERVTLNVDKTTVEALAKRNHA